MASAAGSSAPACSPLQSWRGQALSPPGGRPVATPRTRLTRSRSGDTDRMDNDAVPKRGICRLFVSGAAQESNLPTHGLHALADFEDRTGSVLRDASRGVRALDRAPHAGRYRPSAEGIPVRDRLKESPALQGFPISVRTLAHHRGITTTTTDGRFGLAGARENGMVARRALGRPARCKPDA